MASKIKHVGSGMFIDTDPVGPPDGVEDDPNVHIYAYAKFRSLEHVSYGLYRTTDGPEDKEIDSESVGQYGMEPIARYWEVGIALDEMRKEERRSGNVEFGHLFEEEPLVEVTSEKDFDAALDAMNYIEGPKDSGAWEGPGLYDFRDEPPSFHGSVEDYELEEMEQAADDAIEFMFQGDEWEDAYRALAEEDDEEEERSV